MSTTSLIARDELRLMLRNRVAVIAFVLLVLLTLVAVASSWSHQRGIAELRARHQQAAEQAFDAQPDRHPHRVVHYGHFIFRPLGPLAAFDPGVDAFTGNSMFLEGHRQNTANFGDVRQSSLLIRFGQLTPAFVLQVVAPLLLIFLGYGALAREIERGTLRLLMVQGVSRRQVVLGKLSALGLVAWLAGLPAMIGFVAIAGQPGAAYYSFHPTWDAPAPLAFAALGMRDVSPYILRVRALGLEAQLYNGDTFNPELALPGRFDFAFVLVFLAPLFVIALFHDLVSGEREAGRLRTLEALPRGGGALMRRRTVLRLVLLWTALGLPFMIATAASAVSAVTIAIVLLLIAAYLSFWIALAALVGRLRWSSVTNAASLAALWLIIVLVVPTLAHVGINRAIPVDQGAEIALAQREAVNGAWDIPREDTMRRFYASNPEWADSPPLGPEFHYKWYLAFHQNGDASVADRARAYCAGLERRDAAARKLGWVLPPVGVQALLTRLADTDLRAQLAYQDRIRDFHRRLREFYYGYLFRDRPFTKKDFDRAPTF